jgi:hypothetical protein
MFICSLGDTDQPPVESADQIAPETRLGRLSLPQHSHDCNRYHSNIRICIPKCVRHRLGLHLARNRELRSSLDHIYDGIQIDVRCKRQQARGEPMAEEPV